MGCLLEVKAKVQRRVASLLGAKESDGAGLVCLWVLAILSPLIILNVSNFFLGFEIQGLAAFLLRISMIQSSFSHRFFRVYRVVDDIGPLLSCRPCFRAK